MVQPGVALEHDPLVKLAPHRDETVRQPAAGAINPTACVPWVISWRAASQSRPAGSMRSP
jgi:hypothetical protein